MTHLRGKYGYHDLSSKTESKAPASTAIKPKRQAQMKLRYCWSKNFTE